MSATEGKPSSKIVDCPSPKPEATTEERAHRLKVEVERLGGSTWSRARWPRSTASRRPR